ncbi:hypothetical protein OC834_005048 [Tilletia horrida]|nr:hypothetical protein OC834_005048 [Tilletia horrida]
MAEHLLTRLAQLDSTALAHILLQHAPALSTPIRTILTQLAHAQLRASCVPAEAQLEVAGQGQQGRVLVSLATVLRRALSRGDPSLARMLLPGTPALVDLAIAIGTLHSHAGTNDEAAATASKTLRAALRALVDPHLAAEILSALHASLKSAVLQPFGAQQLLPSATNLAQASPSPLISTLLDIQKRARMLALLLRALPLTGYNTSSSFSSEGKKDPYTAVLAQLAQDLGALHDVVLPALTRAAQAEDTAGAGAALAAAQTHTRDAALSLLLLFRPSSGAHAAGASTAVSTIVAQLKPASSTASPAVAGATLVDAIRARFLADSETAWDELMVALKKNASPASLTAAPTELLNVPDVLLSALRKHQQRLGAQLNGARARKGKARAMKKDKQEAPPIDPALLATVQSVLPHLDTPSLGRRLQRSKYAGKSAEQVIDLLLESTSGNEDDDDDENGAETEEEDGDYEGSRDLEEAVPYEPPAPIVRAAPARRANIFDDAGPLDLSKFRYKSDMPSFDSPAAASLGEGAAKGGLHAIPSALKASVLARVAAQQREELEEEEDEEDGETGLRRGVREAGFEEELETDETYLARNGDEFDWVGRRGMTSALASAPSGPIGRGAGAGTGRVPNAREWRRRIEDESDEDEDEVGDGDADENAHSGGGPSTAGVVPPAPTPGTSGSSSAASERAADRILTRYYAQYGAALFARNDPALRKGNNPLGIARRQLLAELERETGKSWDGGLVESWGTMFERNPRKDRLLAKSTDLLGPNPNRPAAPDAATAAAGAAAGEGAGAGGRQFGPDRGRGGRIIRGVGARGGGRGGGGTGGGGSSGSGSGSANGPGKGQHSGSNRAARQKEKRGSSARFRGRGGGMARSGAFPAGVGE